ncbi:hypothetical protein DICPUDRAFT_147835 [Dictyostelium purpureum]|uniref:phosphomevalonate kinase n=1 Tax=Dictyostelium purpureum TaxID=5786 RepID=F0Z9J1_DICPU|nr:uncharacterized protein DICPUDRAFT_147835 [Dictyostelium purpureum]EGC39418.1 hypothetical protein DICPUDRAFT_147835 [Dictyostelium purpureum]|eukprot:XP_003284092.1 hypothetical protein DICPUDRAFT_147835 [Dictyostelium purpureum]
MENKKIICSSPGKVLVTGGYLVLDKKYDGIVFTIDSRFFTTVEGIEKTTSKSTHEKDILTKSYENLEFVTDINVISPQFHSSQKYHLYYNKQNQNKLYELVPFDNENYRENKYVENTILYSLLTMSAIENENDQSQFNNKASKYQLINITIVGDNGFYSQIPQLKKRNLSISFESLKSLPKFLPVTGSLEELQKTGLGSSAALVSSLTAALLSFFNIVELENKSDSNKLLADKTLLHNLAQISHCIAQGKIGSGFDISSAVFGSQVYRRFSPEIIQSILKLYDSKLYPNPKELLEIIKSNDWDNKHLDMGLPIGLKLLLADVSIGSNTPVMVKKILEWRKNDPTNADKLWNQLDMENTNVKHSFIKLNQLYQENNQEYLRVLNQFGETDQNKWNELSGSQEGTFNYNIGKTLINIRQSFYRIRELMREMGAIADVPLEPKEQTELADSTMNIKGCVAAGVPGAGGFDALFAIVISNEDEIKNSWMTWKECQVLPLVLNENSTGVAIDMTHVTPKL